jgi:hypothetical protein
LETDSDIETASINEPLAESTNVGERWRGNFGLLYEDHAEGNGCTLVNEIDQIFDHGFEDLDGILQSSACVGDAACKSTVDLSCNSGSKAVQSVAPYKDFLIAGKRLK